MLKFMTILLIIFLSIGYTASVSAKTDAEKANRDGLQAVTIFVDISRFSRKNGAADKMTESHQEFAQYGYVLVAVNVYTENGDLEGFFVSYRKETANNKP